MGLTQVFYAIWYFLLIITALPLHSCNGRIIFMAAERIVVFIDRSNLYHELLKNFGNANVDLSTFVSFLVGKDKLVRAYYYNAPLIQKDNPEGYKNQQKFFSALGLIPKFELKLGRLEKRSGVFIEKLVDVKMAVDIVTHAYSNIYDLAIIVSADSDFVPAIEAAQDFGKKVINVCLPKTKAFHLNAVCNKTIFITEADFIRFLIKKG